MESTAGAPTDTSPPGRIGVAIALALLSALAAFGALLWLSAPPPAPDVGEGGHVLPVPREIPAFALVDHRGEPFDRARLEGGWSLLFFGYASCPDICPMTLGSLARVQPLLPPDDAPRVVFVSVDPARDSSERLAQYVAHFDPSFVGATGEPREIERLSGAMGAYFAEAEGGLVDHASSLFLVDPQARLHAVLHEPDEPEAFVALLATVQAVERSP